MDKSNKEYGEDILHVCLTAVGTEDQIVQIAADAVAKIRADQRELCMEVFLSYGIGPRDGTIAQEILTAGTDED